MADSTQMLSGPLAHRSDIDALRGDLVTANRILLRHGIVDAFGHVSVRHPAISERFLMAKRVAPGLVQLEDIREFGRTGDLVDDDGSPVFLERFIHSEIYASRVDVQAIVHSHSPGIIAFGLVQGNPLRAVCHTCGFLNGPTPIFEIREAAGEATNLLIDCAGHGHELARKLGDASVVLMRGHGSTVVGSSLGQAVYRAVYTETNARIQATASSLGTITFLSEGEANATEATSDLQVERTWHFWKAEVEG